MAEEIQISSQNQQHKPRINLQELRNCDLVSRFLAATPPYLYSAPTGPNNFFFSEMLRSLVQARMNDHSNRKPTHASTGQSIRRSRKRVWAGHQRSGVFDPSCIDYKEPIDKTAVEKPLELTNKIAGYQSSKYQKSETTKLMESDNFSKSLPAEQPQELKDIAASYPTPNGSIPNQQNIIEPPIAEIPPSDLVLPPPPPMWYPPLYPPYGIDPLHFFIDLRVSGHIYDRKKENISPSPANLGTVTADNSSSSVDPERIGAKTRHGSAFSVPPRRDRSPSTALNLTFSTPEKSEDFSKFYKIADLKTPSSPNKELTKNTNYVLQNLPKIYTNLTHQTEERNSVYSEETDSKSDFDVQDIDTKDDVLHASCPSDDFDNGNDVVIVDNKTN